MIQREKFYQLIRAGATPLFRTLNTKQVAGFEDIFLEWDKSKNKDIRQLAYMLATAYHETAATMQPIEEFGKGKKYKYGVPDQRTGLIYYGRGLVQITWYDNYLKFEKLLDIPLTTKPELACVPATAIQIMFIGMTKGLFTGKKLSDYINEKTCDFVNARRIINGIDCAEKIAKHAEQYLTALN